MIEKMKTFFYHYLIALSKSLGFWFFKVVAWGIASSYYLFSPRRVAIGVRFYRALFPKRKRWYHLCCTWRQYHNFPQVYLDRLFVLSGGEKITHTHEGWEYLEDAVNSKTGGIIVMSHVGNWEVASHLLAERGRDNMQMKLLLYMGQKHKEQIEYLQKKNLVGSGVKIIAVPQDGGFPMDIIEGINFLKAGGLVSMAGDRRWRDDQRSVPVEFLGHEVLLPEIPFVFALLSGAPLFAFFTYQTGRQSYHFKILPPEYVRLKNRSERTEVIKRTAQSYARHLEDIVRSHPFEWYNFGTFIGQKLADQRPGA
ncbi:MAG: lysophospholipid acyltransferase family protein [Syntrophales bacterium]|jgi:predicted LPLAT superfamily acyltransferase